MMTTTHILALIALILLQLITSFDNVSFLTLASEKLTKNKKKTAFFVGISISVLLTLILLWAIMQFAFFNTVLFTLGNTAVTPRFLVLFLGGSIVLINALYLLINNIKGINSFSYQFSNKDTLGAVIFQIALFNFALSFDSILIALGLVGNLENGFYIIILSILIYSLLMMFLADDLSIYLVKHKLIRIAGYAAIVLLALLLIMNSLSMQPLYIFSN